VKPRPLLGAVFLMSAAALGYEVALTRILSIAEWHHFAYMIISLALLGFAASGTAIALLGDRVRGREPTLFRGGALLLMVALPGSHAVAQAIPFETFELLVRPVQFAWLLLLYGVLSLPFFIVSWCTVLAFLLERDRVGRVYFANLLGSGLGAAAVIGLLFVAPPARLPLLLTAPVIAAYLLVLTGTGARGPGIPRPSATRWLGAGSLAVLITAWIGSPEIRVSPYKGLSYAMDLPDARVLATAESPLSALTAVSSSLIRETPGQISGYPMAELGELPEQVGLYFDADAVSPVHRFDGSLEPFAFLDYVTPALPYQVLDGPETLVVGSGGGTEVLNGLYHGAGHVTALEVDSRVLLLIEGPLGHLSGGLFARPDVTPVVTEARGWLEAHPEGRFDLIQISLLDSFTASAAGVRALSESYLYTLEAVELYLARLSPGGVLAITRWLRTPPRDAIKMFATLVEAAERAGIREPARHLAFVRSWNTATMLLSRSPLSGEQVEAIRSWAGGRGFDLSWLPGLEESDVNRFTVLDEPVYWEAARRVLADEATRERFYDRYAFHVRPATDDRPYYFRFFKWASLPRLVDALGGRWTSVVEWGYLVLIATALQAGTAAVLLVLAPLFVVSRSRRRRRATGRPRGHGRRGADGGARPPRAGSVLLYFSALGLAYLFLEIAFIQKLMLFLSHPVYAVAVVLSAFLVFSGLGSALADRRVGGAGAGTIHQPGRLVASAVALIAALVGVYLVLLPHLFSAWSGWTGPARVLVSLALLAPLAFVMGIPFPTGLQVVSNRRRTLVPWAWAVNGAASVLAPPLATLSAVHWGFTTVVGLAVAFYAAACAVMIGGLQGPGPKRATEGQAIPAGP
jgi:hypothetical protein